MQRRICAPRAGGRGLARGALAVCLLALGCGLSRPAPRATHGELDLSGWDFSAGSVTLEGEWAVCWGQLLEPGADCPSPWRTVPVRGLWSDDASGSPFGGKGVATYRLRLLLPAGEDHLLLRAGAPMTASRLWIDGVPQGGTGVVGRSAAANSPDPRRNRSFELPSGDQRVELRVQLANFEFRGGGIRRPWLVGRPDAVQAWVGRGILREFLLCVVGLIVGLAFLAPFALWPRERAPGYFGLFALVIGLRAVPNSISDFGQLVAPWASFDLLLRGEYLGTALALFAGAGYFQTRLPDTMPPRTLRLIQLVALALVPIEMFAPLPLVLATFPLFLVLPPFVLALVLACYGRAWQRGLPGAGIPLAGALAYFFVVGHDVARAALTDFGLDLELFPYFLVIWLLAEAGGLLRAFHRTFERAESLSRELTAANFELQETESAIVRFVPFDFLRLLGKTSIRDVEAGDLAEATMSVLYASIHSLGGLRETQTPQAAFRLANELVARCEPRIYHRDGFVSHYLGDGAVALFPGGPNDAVAAALGILEEVREFNAEGERRVPQRPPVEVGIGIDTGTLLLGTLGGDQRLTSGVVGNALDTAPRIEALTRSSSAKLLITAAVEHGLTDASGLAIRDVGQIRLEQGSEPVAVFEVVAEDPPG